MSKKEEIQESAQVVCADVRISVKGEIDRVRELLNDETEPAEESILRARLSGLEWALADVLRLMVFHQVSG